MRQIRSTHAAVRKSALLLVPAFLGVVALVACTSNTPTPPPATKGCRYVQEVDALIASVDGATQRGLVTTGRCQGFYLDDADGDIEGVLGVPQGRDIAWTFQGEAPQVYAVFTYVWPQGRPSFGRFSTDATVDEFVRPPLGGAVDSFAYGSGLPSGEYRIVANAAWLSGEAAFFNFHIVVE